MIIKMPQPLNTQYGFLILKSPKKSEKGKQNSLESTLLNLEERVSVNPVFSRVAIDLLGYTGIASGINLILGRSIFLALETLLDTAFWIGIGITLPTFILGNIAKHTNKKIQEKYSLSNKQPLETHFKYLDRGFLEDKTNQKLLQKELGLEKDIEVNPVANKLLNTKIGMMFIDFFCLFICSQSFFRLRNWLTEKLSGKQGFSGEFTYTEDDYRSKEAEKFKQEQHTKETLSMLCGLGGNMLVPILCWLLFRSKTKPSVGTLGKIKQHITPFTEYYNTVYMSKYLMLAHVIFNYNLNSIFFFSRSNNEIFENLTKAFMLDFLFFVGDDILSGLAGRFFETKYKNELQGVKLTHKGPFGIPFAKHIEEIKKEVKSHPSAIKEIVEKVSRWNFRIGLTSASLLLGVLMTTFNALSTKHRIEEEILEKNQHTDKIPTSEHTYTDIDPKKGTN